MNNQEDKNSQGKQNNRADHQHPDLNALRHKADLERKGTKQRAKSSPQKNHKKVKIFFLVFDEFLELSDHFPCFTRVEC